MAAHSSILAWRIVGQKSLAMWRQCLVSHEVRLGAQGASHVVPGQSGLYARSEREPYMTTGKNIALTKRTFVDKVRSLLFNMISRLVKAFLPRGKRLLW